MNRIPQVLFVGTIAEAWRFVIRTRRRLLLKASVPFLLSCALYWLGLLLQPSFPLFAQVYVWPSISALPAGVFALRSHQMVLLDGAALLSPSRQRAALAWFVFLGAAGALAAQVEAALPLEGKPILFLFYLPVSLSLGYVAGRLSFVFPLLATTGRLGLGAAWRLSRGNGWRLLFLPAFAALPVVVLVNLTIMLFPASTEFGLITSVAALAGFAALLLAVALGAASISHAFRSIEPQSA